MRSIAVLLLTGILMRGQLQAQVYKVTTDQSDSFSLAFVKLLNCAAERFKDCEGDLIRSTSLMGDDYKLTIPFPGSAAAIIRSRDWDKNAYVEFRGFTGKKSRDQGIRDLVVKIKKALGQQLYDPNENRKDKEIYFYGLSVKDANGYFSMNIELFGGSSSAPIYLLGPEREDESQPKKDFVLLKIYGGIPAYQYYIHAVAAPDTMLNVTLRQLMLDATTDFDKIRLKKTDTLKKWKRMDTLRLNGFDVLMNYRGGSYSANLQFAAAPDSVAFTKQWLYYQQVLQAAVGSGYVYHRYYAQQTANVLYYSREYDGNKPRIYLSLQTGSNNRRFIQIKIVSSYTHPVKRSLDLDEL